MTALRLPARTTRTTCPGSNVKETKSTHPGEQQVIALSEFASAAGPIETNQSPNDVDKVSEYDDTDQQTTINWFQATGRGWIATRWIKAGWFGTSGRTTRWRRQTRWTTRGRGPIRRRWRWQARQTALLQPSKDLRLLRRSHRVHRLQGYRSVPPIHDRPLEDRVSAQDRCLFQAPACPGNCHQARPASSTDPIQPRPRWSPHPVVEVERSVQSG